MNEKIQEHLIKKIYTTDSREGGDSVILMPRNFTQLGEFVRT